MATKTQVCRMCKRPEVCEKAQFCRWPGIGEPDDAADERRRTEESKAFFDEMIYRFKRPAHPPKVKEG